MSTLSLSYLYACPWLKVLSVFPCTTSDDAKALQKYITTYSKHPAQFKYNGKVFASTFAGQECTFGQESPAEGWKSQFLNQLTGENAVFFVPSFFTDPATFGGYKDSIDGMFNVSLSPFNWKSDRYNLG